MPGATHSGNYTDRSKAAFHRAFAALSFLLRCATSTWDRGIQNLSVADHPLRYGHNLAIALLVLIAQAEARAQFGPPSMPPPALPAMATPAAPSGYNVANAAPQLVVDVQVRGNTITKDYEIQKHLRTRKDREFDAELVQSDVRSLVSTGLFRDVQTYTRPADGGVIVIYEVFERPRIQYVRHLGNRGVSEKKMVKEHGLKVGDSINSYATEEARRKIEDLYHRSGFPQAQISILEGDKPGDKGVVFLVNEGALERIWDVEFEGNTIATDARLKTQIESKPGIMWYFWRGKVDRSKIDADVEKLTGYYRSLGYFRARVGREMVFDDSGKWVTLKFVIDEGPRYVVRSVSVEGNVKFASGPLLDFLELKSGQFFDQSAMTKDINTIVDLYGSQGHVFADVQADPRFLEEPGQLDVVYRVQEGGVFSVGDIRVKIEGEYPHTRESVILNRLSLRPGDILDTRELRASERRLKSSQLFETNPQLGDPPKIVVTPPDLQAIGNTASSGGSTVRGQQPEYDSRMPRAPARSDVVRQPSAYPPMQPQVGPYSLELPSPVIPASGTMPIAPSPYAPPVPATSYSPR